MGGHVENEMKFTRQSSDSSCVLTRVLEFLVYNDYSVTKQSEKVYEDHYYDTPDLILFKNDCSVICSVSVCINCISQKSCTPISENDFVNNT